MWTIQNRARSKREPLRYPSDVPDEEWAESAPLIPPASRGGRKRTVNIREGFNGLMYVLRTGCQWRAVPQEFPARSTVFDYFGLWQAEGTLRRIQTVRYVKGRAHEDRASSPTACSIDRQRVKSTETGGGRLIYRALRRANGAKERTVIYSWLRWDW